MLIYPAIDIKNGKCVRLTQGMKEEETIYYHNPWKVALDWKSKGAGQLHVIDLDGAFGGKAGNIEAMKEIIDCVNIPVQIGGGIREEADVKRLIDMGVWRCILGTKALSDETMLKRLLKKYGEKIVVSVDAKDGKVAVEGWVKVENVDALEFAGKLQNLGLKTLVYTDIGRDGMLQGPNFEALKRLRETVEIEIIASGGVSSKEDLLQLKELGVDGAIVGKALYEGAMTLEEAGGAAL
ncbi:1-(5-phosphoribosyl)-5-[(5-phosphoribosylamino)methylideneamino]imidazole-4-carboxamide isomerase [Tindallia californiensis]|uniref:1-(5-phosphoribosyl)-5-[(5-phosphoribosylamino)methylideneamino] imidazole-4-carboxamide isomerase n=1 Tax=Tindallia californiensis TaxID=159292 RepID=A0A1H3ML59_9FIRM|nr:1-(5-phosphoribosyl)-5-[(5-phosphoribosylamino)methylideneamino]imidazole-4-carboxamide isomerase [Tindallia californiensis]SDY77270.1 1-(5-phosphoribosyl)-5-[(5-phosphoribosylamino)methylideneamino] imidazole-4-carboxamide isomerase [Tindallia californiensis]